MGAAPKIPEPSEPKKSRFETIERVVRFAAAVVAILGAGWAVYKFLGSHYQYFPKPTPQDALPKALWLHAFTIFLLVGSPIFLPAMKAGTEYDRAIAASRQFLCFWSIVWVCWLSLYVVWAIFWYPVSNGTASTAVHLTIDALNLASAAFFFLCYLVMVLHTVPPQQYGWFRVVFGVFTFCGLLLLLEAEATNRDANARLFFDWVQGLLSGVALALFVGRLESHFFDSSKWVVGTLYGYAVIQLSYPLLETSEPDKALRFILITSLALLLKVLLYWQVRTLVYSGRLTYYMFMYRSLIDKDPPDLGGLFE
jgi:hypothetical protein